MSTRIGSGFAEGGGSGGVETKKLLVDATFGGSCVDVDGAAVAVLDAALITDLKLKMLLRPPPVTAEGLGFVLEELERLALSRFEFDAPELLPNMLSMPDPPITTAAAAPIKDDPINPVVVAGLSEHV